jgi:16S rRNA (guanine527-N7)-methyltransferase
LKTFPPSVRRGAAPLGGGTPPLPPLAGEAGRPAVSRETLPGVSRETLPGVSRETLARLERLDALLLDWTERHNLIARSTIAERWTRHYLDSAQLFALIPETARTLVDLGSGAGFPGLILAAMGGPRLEVTLVESTAKKAAFLRSAANAMGLANAIVRNERAESLRIAPPDIITARALAPLSKLLGYAAAIAGENTVALFPKGRDARAELDEAAKDWRMDVESRTSMTSPESSILVIRRIRKRGPIG